MICLSFMIECLAYFDSKLLFLLAVFEKGIRVDEAEAAIIVAYMGCLYCVHRFSMAEYAILFDTFIKKFGFLSARK